MEETPVQLHYFFNLCYLYVRFSSFHNVLDLTRAPLLPPPATFISGLREGWKIKELANFYTAEVNG